MGISLGIVGLGSFGKAFADLFRSHPLVDRIALCDLEPDRAKEVATRPGWDRKFRTQDYYRDYEDLLKSDVDAVAIFTQPWLHAPQAVHALETGKHVYSAVPVLWTPDGDEILEWCGRLTDASRQTGMLYMLGETTFYRAETMFCRRKAQERAFGEFVYAEGEYIHDLDDTGCSLRDVQKSRTTGQAGLRWLEMKETYRRNGILDGPMHYPTHSVSGPISVMRTRAETVTAHGYRNRNNDPYFADHAFSNETAFFRLRNGASLRVLEFREVAGSFHSSETFRIAGTRGMYAEGEWKDNQRTEPFSARTVEISRPTVEEMRDPLPPEVALAFHRIKHPDTTEPADFTSEGHGGSHPYLVHEFIDAVSNNRLPAIHAWEAAHYTAMGVTAHKSALRHGESLSIPDFGEPPAE